MSDQQLDDCEMLNVRWAYDDPNPKARKEVRLWCILNKHSKAEHF